MMQCPRCGYNMAPFERMCPRCARLGAAAPQAPAAGAGPVITRKSPSPFGRSTGSDRTLALSLFGLVLVMVATMFVARTDGSNPRPAHGAAVRGADNLVTVRSVTTPGGANVAGGVDAGQISRRLLDAGATMGGDVEISLAWNTLTDLDLEVRDPSGELITAEHRHSQSGGEQDVDANPTPLSPEGEMRYAAGQPPGQENVEPAPDILVDLDKRVGLPGGLPDLPGFGASGEHAPGRFTRTPVEHIYFARAPRGTYTVYASCFSWREPDRRPLPFTIQVRSRDRVILQTTGVIGPASYVADGARPIQVCQFTAR